MNSDYTVVVEYIFGPKKGEVTTRLFEGVGDVEHATKLAVMAFPKGEVELLAVCQAEFASLVVSEAKKRILRRRKEAQKQREEVGHVQR